MRRDDEFDGTTYVNHHDSQSSHTTPAQSPEAKKPRAVNLSLEERVAALEAELRAHKEQVEKKLLVIEKLAKNHHLSPAERVLLIQEES